MTHLPRREGGQSAMVTSSNVVFFYLTFLRLVCPCHHRQRRRLQPACFLGRFTICTTSPERRPGARTKHAPAIIDLKMFDNEVSGLRWFVFASFQTNRKQQRTRRVKCSLCFPFFYCLLFSSFFITGPLLWIAISRSGSMHTLWEEQESRWMNIKRERSKKKKKNLLSTQILWFAVETNK